VDLEQDALRPGAPEFGRWDRSVKKQRSFRSGARLCERLRRQHAEREPGVDDLVPQAFSRESTALDDGVVADSFHVRTRVGAFGEGLAFKEIRGVDVSGSAELVREYTAPGRQSERMMEEQKLSHASRQPNPTHTTRLTMGVSEKIAGPASAAVSLIARSARNSRTQR
jgi:hypothetical protein